MKRIAALGLVLVVLFSLTCTGHASNKRIVKNENDASSYMSDYFPVCGDQFSPWVFDTLADAKRAFGWDRTYKQTFIIYMRKSYNYCFLFSSGGSQFFNVRNLDNDNDCEITSVSDRSYNLLERMNYHG